MGSWGYYPKDSDGALDLQGNIGELINKELKNITKNHSGYSGYNYAGLIMLMLQKGFFIKIKFVEKALEYIEVELKNTKKGNKSGWGNPEKAIEVMEFLIMEFQKLIDETKKTIGNGEVIAPRNWLARSFELEFGSSWSGLLELHENTEFEVVVT